MHEGWIEISPYHQPDEGSLCRVRIAEEHMDQTFYSEALARWTSVGWELEDGGFLAPGRERVTHFCPVNQGTSPAS